ncbi:MAG: tail fiber domain-containing protein [Cyclobacteriaceae bacterium]
MSVLHRLFPLLIAGAACLNAHAQTSGTNPAISYQTVVYEENPGGFGADPDGKPVINKELHFRFSIRADSKTGLIVYEEMHEVRTNQFAVANALIGRGGVSVGQRITDLDWAETDYYLEVAIDMLDQKGFRVMSVEPLVVPPWGKASPQLLSIDGGLLSISGGNSIEIGDADETNELIQNVSLNAGILSIADASGTHTVDLSNLSTELFNGDEIQDLELIGDVLRITKNNEATEIDLSLYLDNTNLTEAEVDAFVSNNGYLMAEMDGSVSNELQDISTNGTSGNISLSNGSTINLNVNDGDSDAENEIQDLEINSNSLRITNNSSATTIDLTPYLDDTQLTETEVDAFVSNNGYLTTEIDGSVTNELQDISLSGSSLSITDGSTIDLSSLDTNSQLTETEVDDMVSNNGYLTAEVDGSVTNELQNISLSGSDLSITGGSTIDLSGIDTDTQLTEAEVDDMVNNNGYLTAEVDGSVTNEIQDLDLNSTTHVLNITDNATPTDIDLTPYHNTFQTTANVTSNENGDYATDDFVFGSRQLDNDIFASHDNYRMLFDKSLGAFRAGIASSYSWNETNLGHGSAAFGFHTTASGTNSFASGRNTVANGYSSFAIGRSTVASGYSSVALGYNTRSRAIGELAVGYYNLDVTPIDPDNPNPSDRIFSIGNGEYLLRADALSIFRNGAFASGVGSFATGTSSRASGFHARARSFAETALGTWNTSYIPNNVVGFDPLDRLFVLGNGPDNLNASDALIMLKNGNTTLHGALTIDADNVGGNDGYTLPGQDGAANQVPVTNGAGVVSWSDVDASTTNEIQDLDLNSTTHVLNITENATPTDIDLTPYHNTFQTTGGVTSNENGDYATNDFVFGSTRLDQNGNFSHNARMFFDKSKGAFRAGYASSSQWNNANVGHYSVAFGQNTTASGHFSLASGYGSNASAPYSTALGYSSASADYATAIGNSNATGIRSFAAVSGNASGPYSISIGSDTDAIGLLSVAIGSSSRATNVGSIAIGSHARSNGHHSFAGGLFSNVSSYAETGLGLYNTIITPIEVDAFDPQDRLFIIGNGTAANRSDALVMLKNGNTTLHGELSIDADNVGGSDGYTLPGQDGAANQVPVTNGAGVVSWSDVDASTTNEIQDLDLNATTHVLNITENATPTDIDLTPYHNTFQTTANVTSNENGNYANDDFVFGSPQMDDDGDSDHDARMFFDKSKGAFRVGVATGSEWDDANVGIYSAAMGYNTEAIGTYSTSLGSNARANSHLAMALGNGVEANNIRSIAMGVNSTANADNSIAIGNEATTLGEEGISIGTNTIADGANSIAIGNEAETNGLRSTSIGYQTVANGNHSVSIGRGSIADHETVAIGRGVHSNGYQSMAIGHSTESNGYYSTAIGLGTISSSRNEFALGYYNTEDLSASVDMQIDTDRLLVVGNGIGDLSRSDALIMLKNGNTTLHGELTIDADNVGGNDGYTLPGQDGAANQVPVTDGAGVVSWSDVDASTTNEIQDLDLNATTHVLNITDNPTPTDIDLTPYHNTFQTTANITSNENGNYANDDFVFGSPQMDDDGDPDHDARMFFNKSKGAFRAGRETGSDWDDLNVGGSSFATGFSTIASGSVSFASGLQTEATGAYSFSGGVLTISSGQGSIALGYNNTSSGSNSTTFGSNNHASGSSSVALGNSSFASGRISYSQGWNVYARSFAETVIGYSNTDYIPNDTESYDPADRVFVVGNGNGLFGDPLERSDALIMLKNGNTTLHGEFTIDADNVGGNDGYTLPGQDGATNQVPVTDGAGVVSWSDVDASTSNEIQDLELNTTTHELNITDDPTPANIDLTPYHNTFQTTANVTSNENGDYATDDFVFGSSQMDDDGDPEHDARVFFDKDLGAFRAGVVTGATWDETSRGMHSIALGYRNEASGDNSLALGPWATATGANAIAIGDGASATNLYAHAFGRVATAIGQNTQAFGYNATAVGNESTSIGRHTISSAYGETALGLFNTPDASADLVNYNSSNRLLVIGNGTADASRSDALILLKNGNTTLHGELTIDADNVGGSDGYTLPGQDGTVDQILTTDGSGVVSWSDPTDSPAFTTSNLGPLSATSNAPGNYAIDDFVFGSPQLDQDGDPDHYNRMLFDKDLGAFRAGSSSFGDWNESNRGFASIALGNNSRASGIYSISAGRETNASADESIAIGSFASATATRAVSLGFNLQNNVDESLVIGRNNTVLPADMLVTIGNGVDQFNPSNALIMLKNGNTTLHGELTIDVDNVGGNDGYTLPGQDGTADQIMRTDGVGGLSWSAISPTGAFSTIANVTRNASGDYTTDDFVFGSPQLNDDGDVNHNNRFFFDKGSGAFRTGRSENNEWDNRGNYSFASGIGNFARSYGETVVGTWATDLAGTAGSYQFGERLFVIGDGQSDAVRQDALTIYKNGSMIIDRFFTQINGDLDVTGNIVAFNLPSDRNLKMNINKLDSSLEKIIRLEGVSFQWNGIKNIDTTSMQSGFIAQEVQEVFPELVKEGKDGYLSMKYIDLIAHLVEAIKELKQENEMLRSKNKSEMTDLKKRLSDMEELIKGLAEVGKDMTAKND